MPPTRPDRLKALLAALTVATLCAGGGVQAQAQVPPIHGVMGGVLTPDSAWALRGRETVRVRWSTDVSQCANPSFDVGLSTSKGGALIAGTRWSPGAPVADWRDFSLDVANFRMAVRPLWAGVMICCDFNCAPQREWGPVELFLGEEAWLGPNRERELPELAQVPHRLVGTDGRGTVWLQPLERSRLRRLSWMGKVEEIDEPTTDLPGALLGVAPTPEGPWAVTRSGAWLWGGQEKGWLTVLDPDGETLVALAPAAGEVGPCIAGEEGTLWCRDAEVRDAWRVGQAPGLPLAARLLGEDLWALLADGSLVRVRISGDGVRGEEPAMAAVVYTGAELIRLAGGEAWPTNLAVSADGAALWLGGQGGVVWRIELAPARQVQIWPLPPGAGEVDALVDDGGGGVIAATSRGVCQLRDDASGCVGRDHGWEPGLEGLARVAPGVIWIGDRFIAVAPPDRPYYLIWFAAIAALSVLVTLGQLIQLVRTSGRAGLLPAVGGWRGLGAWVSLLGGQLGWTLVMGGLILPQALMLGLDRLLDDGSVTALPVAQLLPSALFLVAFWVAVHTRTRWVLPPGGLPTLVLALGAMAVNWVFFLGMWVWPPHPRPPELGAWMSLLHFLVAVSAGVSTVLYLFSLLARWPKSAAEERAELTRAQ